MKNVNKMQKIAERITLGMEEEAGGPSSLDSVKSSYDGASFFEGKEKGSGILISSC